MILNFIFIPKFLSVGAAIGTIIAEAVVTAIQLYCIRKEYNIKEVLFMSIKYIISSLVMLMVILLLNKFILYTISVVTRMIIDVIIGIGIYLISLIILKDEFLKKLINRIFKFKNKGEN